MVFSVGDILCRYGITVIIRYSNLGIVGVLVEICLGIVVVCIYFS